MADGGWRVSIRPSADREIDELDDSVRREVIATDLKDDPFPSGSLLLRGYEISVALGSIGRNSVLSIRFL